MMASADRNPSPLAPTGTSRALAAGPQPATSEALASTGAIVRAAAGALLAALVIAALYFGREILVPLALAWGRIARLSGMQALAQDAHARR